VEGKGGGRGKGGEMSQTLYAHMNIIKKEKKEWHTAGILNFI
jgi:hypothetical protein